MQSAQVETFAPIGKIAHFTSLYIFALMVFEGLIVKGVNS